MTYYNPEDFDLFVKDYAYILNDFNMDEEEQKQFKERFQTNGATVFAYSDYVGDFIDRVGCRFLSNYADPKDWKVISTCFYGEIGFYTGESQRDHYLLSDFPDIANHFEDFFYEETYKAEEESFQFFVDDVIGKHRPRLNNWAMNVLLDRYCGYFRIMSSGSVDFCSSDLAKWLFNQKRHQ